MQFGATVIIIEPGTIIIIILNEAFAPASRLGTAVSINYLFIKRISYFDQFDWSPQ